MVPIPRAWRIRYHRPIGLGAKDQGPTPPTLLPEDNTTGFPVLKYVRSNLEIKSEGENTGSSATHECDRAHRVPQPLSIRNRTRPSRSLKNCFERRKVILSVARQPDPNSPQTRAAPLKALGRIPKLREIVAGKPHRQAHPNPRRATREKLWEPVQRHVQHVDRTRTALLPNERPADLPDLRRIRPEQPLHPGSDRHP